MKLRTYRAYSMAEALAAVKRDLGPDAVILNTRTSRSGGFLGLGRSSIVEVTAVPAEDAAAPRRQKPRPSNAGSAARAYGGGASRLTTDQSGTERPESAASLEQDQRKTREFARAMLERLEAQRADESEVSSATEVQPSAANSKNEDVVSAGQQSETADAQPVARRYVLQSPGEAPQVPDSATREVKPAQKTPSVHVEPKPEMSVVRQAVAGPAQPGIDCMQTELSAIREMVGQVLRHQSAGGRSTSMPDQLFDYYLKLVAQDLSEDLADSIINDVRAELRDDELDDAECVQAALMRKLAEYVPCSNEPLTVESPDDRPLTIALVGPTGVGKTTTLAKLAATLKLQHDRNVGLITSDTYRIAAVDQLRTYAGIIGLPLEVVLTPVEMTRAVERMQHLDAILIDTAGRSQRDTGRIDELKTFMAAANPHEVHLVLSSTASEKVLLQEAEAFASVGVDKLVFTKLDEAVSFGMLINVARQLGTQLSFFTTGQEVPDHLEIGQPSRLAELVLGGAVNS